MKSSFAKTLWTMEQITQRGLRMSINTVIQRSNYKSILDIYEGLKRFDYEYHGISLYEPDSANIDAVRIPPEEAGELNRLLLAVEAAARRDGKNVVLSPELAEAYTRRVQGEEVSGCVHPGLGCTVPLRGVVVDYRGEVFPCWHYPWSRFSDTPRNVRSGSLASIVDGDRYRAAIGQAVIDGGCAGCSTMCYNWDPDFRRKVMEPELADRMLGLIQHREQPTPWRLLARGVAEKGRHFARGESVKAALKQHPEVYAAARRVYGRLVGRPQGPGPAPARRVRLPIVQGGDAS